MIETAFNNSTNSVADVQNTARRKVLRMEKNERMGGSVPVWGAQKTAKDAALARLDIAAAGPDKAFEKAMAYAHQETTHGNPEEFGFGDLVDMVNPLQHLPIVGHIYREVTGDEIKPISRIIGGGIFGGGVGAATGLVDTIVEYETGKTMAENVVSYASTGEKITYRSTSHKPEERLQQAVNKLEDNKSGESLPAEFLGFTNLGYGKQEVYEKVSAADGRTAGSIIKKYERIAPPADMPHHREPITTVQLSALPPVHSIRSYND